VICSASGLSGRHATRLPLFPRAKEFASSEGRKFHGHTGSPEPPRFHPESRGYKGPVGLQCYQIPGAPEDHLKKSIAKWKEIRGVLDGPVKP